MKTKFTPVTNHRRLSGQAGFTITEILIVLAIVAGLALAVMFAAQMLKSQARDNARRRDINLIKQALSDHQLSHQMIPWTFNQTFENQLPAWQTFNLNALGLSHYQYSLLDSDNTINPKTVLPQPTPERDTGGNLYVNNGDILRASAPTSYGPITVNSSTVTDNLTGQAGFMNSDQVTTAIPGPDLDVLLFVGHARCDPDNSNQIKGGGSNQDLVVVYQLESQALPRCETVTIGS